MTTGLVSHGEWRGRVGTTSPGGRAPTPRGAASVPWRTRVDVAVDLAVADVLVRLRVPWRPRHLLRAVPLLVVLVPLWWALVRLASSIVVGASASYGGPRALLVLDLAVLCYIGIGQLGAELLTARRFSFSGSPHTACLRALDVPAHVWFAVVEGVPRLGGALGMALTQSAVVAALAAGGGVGVQELWIPVALPLAVGALRIALAARAAIRPPQARLSRWLYLPAALAGAALARLGVALHALLTAPSTTAPEVPVVTRWVAGLVIVIAVTAGALGVPALRRLAHGSFVIRASSSIGARGDRVGRVLAAELEAGWGGATVRSVLLVATAVASAALAAATTGVRVDLARSDTHAALATAVFLAGMIFEESLVRVVGIGRFGDHLHQWWSLGADAGRLAAEMLIYTLRPYVALGALLCAGISALDGGLVLWPMAVMLVLCGAAVVVDAMIPAVRGGDGTTVSNPLSTFAGIVLAAPVLAVVILARPTWPLSLPVLSVLLLGGALCALRRRVRLSPPTWSR